MPQTQSHAAGILFIDQLGNSHRVVSVWVQPSDIRSDRFMLRAFMYNGMYTAIAHDDSEAALIPVRDLINRELVKAEEGAPRTVLDLRTAFTGERSDNGTTIRAL